MGEFAGRLALIIAGVVGLAIPEIAVRIAGITLPEVRCYEEARGWRLKPSAMLSLR